jgi:hypothetical protein
MKVQSNLPNQSFVFKSHIFLSWHRKFYMNWTSKQIFLPELITVPHFHTCTSKFFFQKYFTKVIRFYKFKTSDNNISGDKIIINQTVKPITIIYGKWKYSQTCPISHLYLKVTFSCPDIENFIWIGPLL